MGNSFAWRIHFRLQLHPWWIFYFGSTTFDPPFGEVSFSVLATSLGSEKLAVDLTALLNIVLLLFTAPIVGCTWWEAVTVVLLRTQLLQLVAYYIVFGDTANARQDAIISGCV
jgi:hypothetical protein